MSPLECIRRPIQGSHAGVVQGPCLMVCFAYYTRAYLTGHIQMLTSFGCFSILSAGDTENCNTFVHGEHGGARRTATPFLSAEDAEGAENCNSFVHGGHGGTRRTSTSFLSAEGAENFNTFVHGGHGGARRTATSLSTEDTENCNAFLSAEGAENCNTFVHGGHGEHLFDPLRGAKNTSF